MPFGDYNFGEILSDVRSSRKDGVARQFIEVTQKAEILEQENKLHKSKLKVHEDREKRRMDGLKKAQSKRKKVKPSGKK